jgi:hypothetical protein
VVVFGIAFAEAVAFAVSVRQFMRTYDMRWAHAAGLKRTQALERTWMALRTRIGDPALDRQRRGLLTLAGTALVWVGIGIWVVLLGALVR